MTKPEAKRPLELPDYLSSEEMYAFMTDPNVRAARREARRAKLATPAGNAAIRGFTRDWLLQEVDVIPTPMNIDSNLAALLQVKMQLIPPMTDKITSRYDIFPYKKSAEGYGKKHQRNFLARVRSEERDPMRIAIFEQGATRSLEHVRDNLQWNLWLKTRIAEWRLAYVDSAIHPLELGETPSDDSVRQTGGAIADFGYCLREQGGLLKSVDMDITFAHSIEHLGHYVSEANTDALASNLAVAELVQQEQEKRVNYWGERYGATREAFGNRLPDEDLAADADLDRLIDALYSQDSNTLQASP